MDSKHRHELAENALANWLADAIDRVRPHATLITICLVGVVLIAAAWAYYSSSSQSNRAQGWEMYAQATFGRAPNLPALEEAAAQFDDKGKVADWASITYADGQLANASIQYLDDRQKAAESIEKAQEEYNRLILERSVQETIRHRAQYGLARSYELAGDVNQAMEQYREVQGAFAPLAEQRAKLLETNSAKRDYEWLQVAQAPMRRAPAGPGTPGAQPAFAPDAIETPGAAAEDEQSLDEILSGITEGAEDGAQDGADVDIGALLEEDAPPTEPQADAPAGEAASDPLIEMLESETADETTDASEDAPPADETAPESAPSDDQAQPEAEADGSEPAPSDDDQ